MKTAIKTAINAPLKTLACALLALAALTAPAAPAHAQALYCEVAPNGGYNVDFGIYQGNTTTAASPGAWRFTCTNNTPTPWNVKICVGLDEGSMGMLGNMRRMKSADDSLRYQLYRDPAASQPYDLPPNDDNNGIQVIATLPPNSETAVETEFRIIGRMPAGQIAAPGVYESTFTGNQIRIRWRRYGVTAPEPPCAGPIPHNVSFAVRALVQPFCQLDIGQHVDFGSQPENAVTGGLLSSGKLDVACSPGLDYSIAMDDGANPQGGLRRMAHSSGNTHTVHYQLCHDFPCTQRWGSHPQERKHGTSIGNWQGYDIFGRVPPGQIVTAVGAYKDTVVVTVHY